MLNFILFINNGNWVGCVFVFVFYFLFKVIKFNVYVIYGFGLGRVYEVLYFVFVEKYIEFDL